MTPNTENMSAAQIALVDDVLAGLEDLLADDGEPEEVIVRDEDDILGLDMVDDLDELETLEPLEAVVVEVRADAVLDDDDLQELNLSTDRAEAYAAQTSTATGDEVATAAVTGTAKPPKEAKTPKTAGAPKTPAAPRAAKDLNTIDPQFFKLSVGDVPDADFRTKVIALLPSQVKIAEKFENLFQAISVGKMPSKYTVEAFRVLLTKETMTSADLIAHYKTMMGEGTARSQCGQMMHLFDALIIAKRTGQSLTLTPGSAIAAYMKAQLAL